MFNGVLEAYLFSFDRSLFDKRYEANMHMEPGPSQTRMFHFDAQALCIDLRAERAFFYVDEMQLDLTPTIDTYRALIRACAEAPHCVPDMKI